MSLSAASLEIAHPTRQKNCHTLDHDVPVHRHFSQNCSPSSYPWAQSAPLKTPLIIPKRHCPLYHHHCHHHYLCQRWPLSHYCLSCQCHDYRLVDAVTSSTIPQGRYPLLSICWLSCCGMCLGVIPPLRGRESLFVPGQFEMLCGVRWTLCMLLGYVSVVGRVVWIGGVILSGQDG